MTRDPAAPAKKQEERIALAEAIRVTCLEAAVRAAEDAGIRGLCAEGRLDAAIDAIRNLRAEELAPAVDLIPDPGDV